MHEAYALAYVNLERLLGIKVTNMDLVAVSHDDLLMFEGKFTVISIISLQRETVLELIQMYCSKVGISLTLWKYFIRPF